MARILAETTQELSLSGEECDDDTPVKPTDRGRKLRTEKTPVHDNLSMTRATARFNTPRLLW